MNLINKHILLIDVSAVCYAGMYSVTNKPGIPGLFHEGKPCAIIFDFLMRLHNYQHVLRPDLVVFTFDSKESKRSELFPEYKVKRNTNKKSDPVLKEMLSITKPQILRLQYKLLPYLGFKNILCTPGLEADDLQARIVRDNQNTMITTVSRDKDLRQFLSPMSRMFDPVSKKLYTHDDLKEDLGCTPAEWKKAFGYSGCTTDEVPGIPGVAIKTALKYLRGDMNPETKTYKKIIEAESDGTVELTKQLVHLPFVGTPSYRLEANQFDNKKLKKLAAHFKFVAIEMMYSEWRFK